MRMAPFASFVGHPEPVTIERSSWTSRAVSCSLLSSCSLRSALLLPLPKSRGGNSRPNGSPLSATIGASPISTAKTDADAVFGSLYAQCEDDFNRVETNYLNSLGRLAESEGESKVIQDLRQKLFVDPADLKAGYKASPAWLQTLMNAFADGVNFYLYKHPTVHPRVLTRFEPWMALSFTEGSIGGDIEHIRLDRLESFYSTTPHGLCRGSRQRSPRARAVGL